MKTIDGSLKLRIASKGDNLDLLACSITSILCGSYVPGNIEVVFFDATKRLDSFVLSQLGHLCSMLASSFTVTNYKKRPLNDAGFNIREIRNIILERENGNFIMVDDDVILDHKAIEVMVECAKAKMLTTDDAIAYICGAKCDVSNLRNYPDFTPFHKLPEDQPSLKTHEPYFEHPVSLYTVEHYKPDTGFIMIMGEVCQRSGITFSTSANHANTIGEDTVFGARCKEKGLKGYFAPNAKAWHLEKPVVRFNETEARKEIVMRTLDSIGVKYE